MIKIIFNILKKSLLIFIFIFLVPFNILSYLLTPEKYRYFDGDFKDYLSMVCWAIRDDWKNF